jgi:hypothetical protein
MRILLLLLNVPLPDMFNGLFQHTAIQVEPDGRNIPVLLFTQQITRPPDLQVFKSYIESCPQVTELLQRFKPPARDP